jgi:hypothetical protein
MARRAGHQHLVLRAVATPWIAGIVVFSLLSTDGLAQVAAETDQPLSGEEIRALGEAQYETMKRLEAEAADRYGDNTPEYWAALRNALAGLSSEDQSPKVIKKKAKRPAAEGPPDEEGVPSDPLEIPEGGITQLDHDGRAQDALMAEIQALRVRPKMFGGRPAVDPVKGDLFPEAAAIAGTNGGICSGVRVGRRVLLTAAHCICLLKLDQSGGQVRFGGSAVAGSGFRITRAVSFTVKTCAPEPGNDLALVFFEGTPPGNAVPASVADLALMRVGEPVYVVGYGKTETGSGGDKLWAAIGLISPLCGAADDTSKYGCAGGKEFVARDQQFGRDSCYGDSGGPAFIYDASSRRYLLAGVVARGIPPRNACGGGGIYTLLTRQKVIWMVNSVSTFAGG